MWSLISDARHFYLALTEGRSPEHSLASHQGDLLTQGIRRSCTPPWLPPGQFLAADEGSPQTVLCVSHDRARWYAGLC